MAVIGILFDIDQLGGGFYGKAAYQILFQCFPSGEVRGVNLYDGDTAGTLHLPGASTEDARLYCIAVESPEEGVIRRVETLMSRSTEPGLRPLEQRFLRDAAAVKAQPLVFAGAIDENGVLVGCETPWIISAWPGAARTSYAVMLNDAGPNKLAVIREVREALPGTGMGEVKALLDRLPAVLKCGLTKSEAMEIVRSVQGAGGKAEVR